MKILRSVLAVILGYAIFAATAVLLFRLLGQDPHQAAPLWIMALSAVYGATFAFAGARIAALVAGYNSLAHAVALAALIALGAVVSLVKTLGHGSVWSQVSALLVMAPSALLSGFLQSRAAAISQRPNESTAGKSTTVSPQ